MEGSARLLQKTVFAVCLLLMIFSPSFLLAELPPDTRAQVRNQAFADAFTQIFENAVEVPASGIAQMAGAFAGGDIGGGLMKIAELGADELISNIPVIGPLKFVAGLETAAIKIAKSYLDDYMVDIFWNKFKSLPLTEQQAFIRGEYVAEIDAALGGYYTVRNVQNLREIFAAYLEEQQNKEAYMRVAGQIAHELHEGMYFLKPEPVEPSDGQFKFNNGFKLRWYTYGANLFQIILNVNGQSYRKMLKLEADHYDASVTLGEFDVDWNSVFQENDGPVDVTWQVKSARYDASGQVAAYVNANYVVGNYKILNLPGYESVKESVISHFSLVSPRPYRVTIQSPANGSETDENSITVTAVVTKEDDNAPAIKKVGFIVNGAVQYSTLNGDSFSTVAVLASGENTIQAGIVTEDGLVILSQKIKVTSNARNNTYHIRITWDKDKTDVDVHFSWSGGSECYYANKTPDWGGADVSPALDVDNRSGYGPENITINALPGPGHYRIYVHYYSDHGHGGTTVAATIDKNGLPIFNQSRYMTDGQRWTLLEFDL